MKTKLLPLVALCLAANPVFAADPIESIFKDGSFNGELQLFDFQRNFEGDTTDRRDTSLGGLFYLRSGEAKGISFGGGFASASPIAQSDSKGLYGLVGGGAPGMKVDRQAVNRLQEYYVRGNWADTEIKVGAQQLYTTMMNIFPLRAIPFTYRGVSVKNTSIDNLAISGLYINDYMGWTDTEFKSVSEGVKSDLARNGVDVSGIDFEKSPMMALGLDYKLPVDDISAKTSLWYYSMEDIYNQYYFNVKLDGDIGKAKWYFKPSYLKQDSAGKLNDTTAKFDTYQAGFHLGMNWNGFDATVKYAKTGDGYIVAPFGDDKVVIQQVHQSARANEDVYAGQLAYSFAKDSALSGVSAYVNYANYEVDGVDNSDFSETDFSVTYDLTEHVDGLSVRARHAIVDYATGDDLTDTRFYVYYKFKI